MQISEYKNIFENEASHFYYVGYHRAILSLLKKYTKKSSRGKLKILDAGCGAGLLTKKLEEFGEVWGIDMSAEAVKFTKKRGLNVKKASVLKLPFKDKTFDVVVSIDVLCHQSIPNDQKALQELHRVTKPKGLLVLKLPSYNWLYGSHDLLVQTKKRYSQSEVTKNLQSSGFATSHLTYIGSFLLPIIIAKHIKELLTKSVAPNSSVKKIWPPLNALLIYLFHIENFFQNLTGVPFGISVLVFANRVKKT